MAYPSFISRLNSLFLIVLLIITASGFGVTADDNTVPKQAEDWQAEAVAFKKSGDLAGAHASYEKIIQTYPNTPYGLEACAKTADMYIKQKQFSNLHPLSVKMCRDFQNQPRVFRTFSDLVTKCMYAEAYPEAMAVCDEVQSRLSLHQQAILAMGWRGMVYARQGDTKKAEQMKQLLLLNDDIPASVFLDAMSNIGWGYHCADQWDQAVATYRQALAHQPDDPQAVYLQYRIVDSMISKGDMPSADSQMQMLLVNYKDSLQMPGLAFRLGNKYYKKTQWQGAINVYERLLTQFGDHELAPSIQGMAIKSYKMLAQRHRRNKQTDLAVATYEAVIERFGDDKQIPAIRDAIVETYAEAGDFTQAQEALQTDIQQCPHRLELVRVMTRIAVHTARAGDTDTAMKLSEAIFDQHPQGEDHQLFGQLFGYTTRARVYVHQGKDAEAEAVVDEVILQYQDHPDALMYHLFGVGEEYYLQAEEAGGSGDLESANKNYLEAISFWEKNIKKIQSSRQGQTHYYVAICYQKIGQMDKAMEYYNNVVTDWPDYKKAGLAADNLTHLAWDSYNANEMTSQEVQGILEASLQCYINRNKTEKLGTLYWKVGQLKYLQKDWSHAADYLERCLKHKSDGSWNKAEVYWQLAGVYETAEMKEKALACYLGYLNTSKGEDAEQMLQAQSKVQRLAISCK